MSFTIYKFLNLLWKTLKMFIIKDSPNLLDPEDLCNLTPLEFQSFCITYLQHEGFSNIEILQTPSHNENFLKCTLKDKCFCVMCLKDLYNKKPRSIQNSSLSMFIAMMSSTGIYHGLILDSTAINFNLDLSDIKSSFNITIWDGRKLCNDFNILIEEQDLESQEASV